MSFDVFNWHRWILMYLDASARCLFKARRCSSSPVCFWYLDFLTGVLG